MKLSTPTNRAAYVRRVDGFSLRRNDPTDDFCKFEGARISNTAIRPFCFTEVALTDDADSACQTEAVVKNLGTIQLDIHRTRILSIKPSSIQYEDTVKQPVRRSPSLLSSELS